MTRLLARTKPYPARIYGRSRRLVSLVCLILIGATLLNYRERWAIL